MSDIKLVFIGENKAQETIEQLVKQLQGVGEKAEEAEPKASSLFQGILEHAGGILSAGIFTKIIGGVGDLASSMVEGNAQFEAYEAQFATLMHSTDGAKQKIKELGDFAAKTPFELPEVIQASKNLLTFGGAALNTQENLNLVGNAAAATGQKVDEVAFWTGRAYNAIQAGKPFGEAAARLQEMGILSGDARAKLEDLQQSGANGAEVWAQFTQTITAPTDAMDKLGATATGLESTLSDSIAEITRTIGAPIFDKFKEGLQTVIQFMGAPSTKEAIKSVAEGLGSMIGVVGDVAGVILDNAVPALIGLGAATTFYALSQLPLLITALPELIASLTAAAASAAATAGAMMVSLGPLALVAAAVYGVVKAYEGFNEKIETATQKLLDSRQWWTDGTKALDDYSKASETVRQVTKGKADALEELRRTQEAEIESLAKRDAEGVVSAAQYKKEMDVINQRADAIKAADAALSDSLATYDSAALHANDATESYHLLGAAIAALQKTPAATGQELEKLTKDLEKTNKEGVTVFAAMAQTESEFMASMEDRRKQHLDRIADLEKEQHDATTKKAKEAIQKRIDDENKGYADSSTAAQKAYAQQEGQQRAHLGQMLIDYVNTKIAMGGMDQAQQKRAVDAIQGITKEYGVHASQASLLFGQSTIALNGYIETGTTGLDAVTGTMRANEKALSAVNKRSDELYSIYLAQLNARFPEVTKRGEEYNEELAKIPDVVQTQIELEADAALKEADQIGADIMDGIAHGVSRNKGAVTAAIEDGVESGYTRTREKYGIHSPSEVFAAGVGLPIVQGIANGIYDGEAGVISAIDAVMNRANAEAQRLGHGGADTLFNQLMGASNSAGFTGGGGSPVTIPRNASGTTNFDGGWTYINEEGPELVRLPRGTTIVPAQQTREMLGGGQGAAKHEVHHHYHLTINSNAQKEEIKRDFLLMQAAVPTAGV